MLRKNAANDASHTLTARFLVVSQRRDHGLKIAMNDRVPVTILPRRRVAATPSIYQSFQVNAFTIDRRSVWS